MVVWEPPSLTFMDIWRPHLGCAKSCCTQISLHAFCSFCQNCSDVDECVTLARPCHPLRECINTAGSYECGLCATEYTSIGRTECVLTNPCLGMHHNCQSDDYCVNTSPGMFSCQVFDHPTPSLLSPCCYRQQFCF